MVGSYNWTDIEEVSWTDLEKVSSARLEDTEMNSFNHQLKGPWAFDDSNIPVTYDEIYQKHDTDSSPNNNRSIEVFNRATAD